MTSVVRRGAADRCGEDAESRVEALHTREVSQIGNVDVDVSVDVESHPVGYSTPQIPLFCSCSEQNSALIFQFSSEKGEGKQ